MNMPHFNTKDFHFPQRRLSLISRTAYLFNNFQTVLVFTRQERI